VTDLIPFDELECPRCGRRGTLEIRGDPEPGGEAPVECTACGRQHPGRRERLTDIFGGL